ncbi:MAG: hypothetical protein U0412_11470 [Nitrospira sp.]
MRAELAHAFATKSASEALTIEDLQLLQRVAETVVKRGMATPAVVFLESLGPMSYLGSQALHFFLPILELAFNPKDVAQVAALLERRDTIEQLIRLIDAAAAPREAAAR